VAVKYARREVTDAASLLADEAIQKGCLWICGLAESMVPSFAL
jgi:hypothetical protein